MGYILPEIYESVCSQSGQQLPKVFIETGTFKGGIPLRMLETNQSLDPFKKVYTIELGHDICKIASMRYKRLEQFGTVAKEILHTDDMDIEFQKDSVMTYFSNQLSLINADSAQGLRNILPSINEPVCFWLDAHAGAQKYARGVVDVPLLLELEAIKNHTIKNHIIAIDDAHMFGIKQVDELGNIVCDYSGTTYDTIKNYILSINSSYDVGLYEPYGMKMLIAYVK